MAKIKRLEKKHGLGVVQLGLRNRPHCDVAVSEKALGPRRDGIRKDEKPAGLKRRIPSRGFDQWRKFNGEIVER